MVGRRSGDASSTPLFGCGSTAEGDFPKLYDNSSWTATIQPYLRSKKPLPSLGEIWNGLVIGYRSRSYQPLVIRCEWDPKYAEAIKLISLKRVINRRANYLDMNEIYRATRKLKSKGECAIRFGVAKSGHGYHGERGDFCLVGGAVKGKDLTLMYRSLELIGGLAFDLCLIQTLSEHFGINWRKLTIFAARANVFALRKNSNELLYPKLREIFKD